MKKLTTIVCIAILLEVLVFMTAAFIGGMKVGHHHAIMHAEPWVDTASNTILIDFDGDVHVYEYCEN